MILHWTTRFTLDELNAMLVRLEPEVPISQAEDAEYLKTAVMELTAARDHAIRAEVDWLRIPDEEAA